MTRYAEFETEFLGPRTGAAAYDGAPVRTLALLSPSDRSRAVQALQQRIEEHDGPRGLDEWAVEGLGHLAAIGTSMPASTIPLLRALLPRQQRVMRARTALALWHMARDDAMLDVVLPLARTSALGAKLHAMLSRYGADYELIQVMHVLAQFPHAAARRRLEELTRDPRYLVRYNAAYALSLRRTEYGIDDASGAPGLP